MTTGPRVTGSEAILKAGVTRTWSEPTSCSSCGAVTPPSLQSPTLQQNTCSAWSPCSSPAGSWRVTELWLAESDHMTWILASDSRVTEHRKQKTLSDFGKNSYLKKLNMNFDFWMPLYPDILNKLPYIQIIIVLVWVQYNDCKVVGNAGYYELCE